jgi:cadmium resistance protein CadD (predicted permease)
MISPRELTIILEWLHKSLLPKKGEQGMIKYRFFFFIAIIITVLLLFFIEKFLHPNIIFVAIGIICIIIGIIFMKSSDHYIEKDADRMDYYLKPNPIHEKLQMISPGCASTSLGLIYLLLGLTILILQVIAILR